MPTEHEEFWTSSSFAFIGRSTAKAFPTLSYGELKKQGKKVFPVDPSVDEIAGDKAYPDLASIPGGVDAVLIATHPDVAEDVMAQAANVGVKRVWMHRGPGKGSVSEEAAALGREWGLTVIPGGCPLMYGPTSDGGHRFMRAVAGLFGQLPREM